MTQPAGPDSADWQRRWTIDAGIVTLEPVTRRIAQVVLDGGPITRRFEEGALHDKIPHVMSVAIRDIDSGAAAVLPTVWLIVRRADERILGDLGTHGPPDPVPGRPGMRSTARCGSRSKISAARAVIPCC